MKKEKKKSENFRALKISGKVGKIVEKPESSFFWQAPEFEYHQKNASWYWLSLIIGIVVFALAIWQKNFLFAIFVVVAWIVIIYLTNRFPTVWKFEINEKGIAISLPNDDSVSIKFYPYGEIESFDIHPHTITKIDSRNSIAEGDLSSFGVGVHSAIPLSVTDSHAERGDEEYSKLIFKLKSKFSPYLKINFYTADEEKIKNFLLKHMLQEEYKESLAESFSRLIRF